MKITETKLRKIIQEEMETQIPRFKTNKFDDDAWTAEVVIGDNLL